MYLNVCLIDFNIYIKISLKEQTFSFEQSEINLASFIIIIYLPADPAVALDILNVFL